MALTLKSFLEKLIGLISTIILARVLVPEDFGLVAIATIFLGLLHVLSDTGTVHYLMRAEQCTDEMLNTSWTLNLILKISLALLFVLLAPLLASYYEEERLSNIIYALSAIVVVNSFGNPATVHFRREQNYLPIIKVELIAKLFAISMSIYIALVYQSYWALILGQASTAIATFIGYYLIRPYRPKFSFENIKAQWHFSGWMLPQSVLGYARTQLDTFLVSSNFGQEKLGSYHVMKYLGIMPITQLLLPITAPLLVELGKIKDNKEYFSHQFNVSFIATMFLSVPICFLMFTYHEPITLLFLGPQWVPFSELLAKFGLLLPAATMLHQANRVLMIYGQTKQMLIYEIASFILLYGILLFVGIKDIFIFTSIRVGLENILCFFYLSYVTSKYTSFKNMMTLVYSLSPVLIGAIIGMLVCSLDYFSNSLPMFELVFRCTVFSVVYVLTILLIYNLAFKGNREWDYLIKLVLRGQAFLINKFS